MSAFAKAERRTPDRDEVDPGGVFAAFLERSGAYLKPADRELLATLAGPSHRPPPAA